MKITNFKRNILHRFEYKNGNSNKFWSIKLVGKHFTVTYGRIGTKGQTNVKWFDNNIDAQNAFNKIIESKVNIKGYRYVSKKKKVTDGKALTEERWKERTKKSIEPEVDSVGNKRWYKPGTRELHREDGPAYE